jgi:cytochrome b
VRAIVPENEHRSLVRAWDGPTRAFHWLMLALIVSAWVSYEFSESLGDELLVWHRWNGLSVLVLLIWRLLWGFAGSSTSRFASFAPSPAAVWTHARSLWSKHAPRYLGHNPLGSLIILVLIGVLLTQAVLGLFAVDDNDLTGGPLSHLVSEADAKRATRRHGFIFFYVLLPLAGLHIAANLYYQHVKREPLITAMITGTKPAGAYADAPEATIAANVWPRAALCLAVALALVFGPLVLAGGKF